MAGTGTHSAGRNRLANMGAGTAARGTAARGVAGRGVAISATVALLLAVVPFSPSLSPAPSPFPFLTPTPRIAMSEAHAEDIDTNPAADEFQQRIEETAAAYAEAQAQAKAANEAIEENTTRIAELKWQIPRQQERSASAARELYKVERQRVGILEMLLSADSFYGFLTNLEYVDRITSANIEEIERLRDMEDELDAKQAELEQAKADADAREAEAKAALAEAQAARTEAQRRAQESARQVADARSAAQAAGGFATAPSDVAEPSSGSGDSGAGDATAGGDDAAATPTPVPTEEVVDDGANWMSDEDVFVNEWAGRIDAYLAGSPMAGQGRTFARAAWNYGVDPRWSPAIACLESSKGLYCFLPYNAWGWGSVSWGSWEEAIDAHVRGLARGYGYTISMDAARKYCPPNADYWYSFVSGQMNLI